MNILLTGATGYIGKRLLPALVEAGHHVFCCTRDVARFQAPAAISSHITTVEVDFLKKESLANIPEGIDGAYYLMHSMSSSSDFEEKEMLSATNFRERLAETSVKHVIYLSGIVNEDELSKHLASRKAVEKELGKGSYSFTALRAGIIIGSGSASFEIIRDLVEKLPVMIAPKWLKTRCQPIGIRDVMAFLSKALFCEKTYDCNFDIAGPDILTYKEMLLGYADVRGLRRHIISVPMLSPKLSSYWLFFVTSTSYRLAASLVESMKVEVVARDNQIDSILGIEPAGYRESLHRTLAKIEENEVVSGWRDSMVSGRLKNSISDFIKVPEEGCFKDSRSRKYHDREQCIDRVWRLGGKNGWYRSNLLWGIRGFIDKLFGGVGLGRGRTHDSTLSAGDAVDFWRVLFADREEGRLLLFAEMRLPGEAWLEFKIVGDELCQTATFRPKGLWGRAYWYAVFPFHGIVFRSLLKELTR